MFPYIPARSNRTEKTKISFTSKKQVKGEGGGGFHPRLVNPRSLQDYQ